MSRSSTRSFPLPYLLLNAAGALLCVGLIVFGALRVPEAAGLLYLAVGIVGLIVVCVALPITLLLHELVSHGQPGGRRGIPGGGSDMGGPAEHLLAQIYENSMLSDNAKRVLFRNRELELLRRAIEEDIRHADYNAGLTLCDEMANLFGHREEAEAYRTRILQANHAAYEAKVHQALEQFEGVLAVRDWARAHRDAASIRRIFPNHHLVQDIDQRILAAREDHKRQLEAQFIEAANRDDVNTAMPLLRQLDRYLTRDEAARLAEVAQDVVVKHRENLSTQFKIAVNDHSWAEAARIGDLIIGEYPNTKMADEVRSMIDVLRVRATQAPVAAAGK